MNNNNGKTAIIIGATSGLGLGVAKELAGKGWRLGVCGRRVERLEAFRDSQAAGMVEIMQMDVTSDDAGALLDQLIERTGAPDLLLYVSGVGFQNRELDEEKELSTVRTNCEGMVRIVDRFMNYVKSSGEYSRERKAHVAVVTSVAGTAGIGTAPAYSATKKMCSTYISALVQLSRMEKIPVQFTDIRPGFVRTEILNPEKKYPLTISVEEGARHMVRAIEHRRRICIFDWRFKLIVFFWRLIPRCLWERLTIVKN